MSRRVLTRCLRVVNEHWSNESGVVGLGDNAVYCSIVLLITEIFP